MKLHLIHVQIAKFKRYESRECIHCLYTHFNKRKLKVNFAYKLLEKIYYWQFSTHSNNEGTDIALQWCHWTMTIPTSSFWSEPYKPRYMLFLYIPYSRGRDPLGAYVSQGETGPPKRREPRYTLQWIWIKYCIICLESAANSLYARSFSPNYSISVYLTFLEYKKF